MKDEIRKALAESTSGPWEYARIRRDSEQAAVGRWPDKPGQIEIAI